MQSVSNVHVELGGNLLLLWLHSYFPFLHFIFHACHFAAAVHVSVCLSSSVFSRTSSHIHKYWRVSCVQFSVPRTPLLTAVLFQPTQSSAILEISSSFLMAVIDGFLSAASQVAPPVRQRITRHPHLLPGFIILWMKMYPALYLIYTRYFNDGTIV